MLGRAGRAPPTTREQTAQTVADYATMLQDLFETYGREVEIVRFEATGAGDDAVAAQADAIVDHRDRSRSR